MKELTPLQRQVLELFIRSPLKEHFYWSGGTALAVVYLHHRYSQDLDFFSDTAFSREDLSPFLQQLQSSLQLDSIEEKKIFDRREFFLHNGGTVRLEFVHYDHPILASRKKWKNLKVDSLDDLATNKIMALVDRNEPKDALDVYFLLTKEKYPVEKLLEFVKKKFGVSLKEDTVWSEALKSAKELGTLKPFIIAKTEKEQAEIIEKTTAYFEQQAKKFLHRAIESSPRR